MARFRRGCALALSLTLLSTIARAEDRPSDGTPKLYDRPVLVVDPGLHTATIRSDSADATGRWAVTGSEDRTVRIWSVADGALLRTIRLPSGPGNVGKAFAVAISPDGSLIAASGSTGWTEPDRHDGDQIYLFDRSSGQLIRRIEGLPDLVEHLAFSKDVAGKLLAATLFTGGLRIYARGGDWTEIARDTDYGDQSYGVDFASDGRLATTSFDGKIRLYVGSLSGNVRPEASVSAPDGRRPFGVAFNPDGSRLAVGLIDSAAVDLLEGRTLALVAGTDRAGIGGGGLPMVAWSSDGETLLARGLTAIGSFFAWSNAGSGPRRTLWAGQKAPPMANLVQLPHGDLLVAAGNSLLKGGPSDGRVSWAQSSPLVDFGGQSKTMSVSNDGAVIDFDFALGGKVPARLDLVARRLSLDPHPDGQTASARQDGLPIAFRFDASEMTMVGTIGDKPIKLGPHEAPISLAIHPSGDRFVLGASWSLRAFDAKGTPLWTRTVPGFVLAVNISGDGRLVVAAYADGTIRWHRMTDGVELLAFMPLPDHSNWVAWTPEGFYAATPGAHGILRWHVNHGWDAPAESIPVEDIPGSFRPAVLHLVLQELETPRALGLAVLAEHNKEVAIRTHSQLPPGVQLHLLTIGISAYNVDYAKNLRLHYADRDAHDLASAIINTQEGLYSHVDAQALVDKDASRGGILRGLQTLRTEMERGGGNDLVVVHFSGHGAMVDGTLYLLPYDTDARDAVGIKSTALSVDAFKGELMEVARHGRVLVLLDACHSGATSLDGSAKAVDATVLRHELAAANVTVLTSSSGSEASLENDAWQHGAFTRALLDALNDPAADPDHVGLINANALAHYVARRVASLTDGKQAPDMEVRFDTTVFAVGL